MRKHRVAAEHSLHINLSESQGVWSINSSDHHSLKSTYFTSLRRVEFWPDLLTDGQIEIAFQAGTNANAELTLERIETAAG